MVTLQKITWYNFKKVISLKVTPEQEDFIADNLYSLAQSYVALSNGKNPIPLRRSMMMNVSALCLWHLRKKGPQMRTAEFQRKTSFISAGL